MIECGVDYLDDENLVTLVASETACLASSPKVKPNSSLDLAGRDGGLLVVLGQLGGLAGDPLEESSR
jgi:hypothetical protein